MSEIIPTEQMFSAFEPKTENRFLAEIKNIPAYVIHYTELPKFTKNTI